MQRYNVDEIGQYQYKFVTDQNITYILGSLIEKYFEDYVEMMNQFGE